MLTEKQEKWVQHLSDESIISIVPFDPTCDEKFESVKSLIQSKLGTQQRVEHRGASSLGISGQDEIDIHIPVAEKDFNDMIDTLEELFGPVKGHYPLERARFNTFVDGKKIEIFIVNEESPAWTEGQKFYEYLNNNPNVLEQYRILKESLNGLTTREYYRKKIEFMNEILK
ncbi:MAG: GrpB family protein [Bacteroidetes bacterium]|nr:GrpB family protein [Bacteroidota bacterium]